MALLFIKKLFLHTSEYASKKSVLPTPDRHSKIPEDALWLAGEGAGSWFCLCKLESLKFKISRYSEAGDLECSGVFKCMQAFCEDETVIKIVYPSNCAIVTLRIGEHTLSFYNIELNDAC